MSSTKVEYNDRIEWHNEKGKLHREDGPAIEWPDGSKVWYLNGELHREGGPAVEHTNGYKAWFLNRECHRVDGPAIQWPDGSKFWYLNDKEYPKEQWEKEVLKLRLKRLSEL